MKKRLLSTVLVFSMLLSVFPMNVIAVEDKTAENAERIATNGLPEVEFSEGLPYAGFTTQQAKLPEKGLYSLTVSRTGDTSIGSDLFISTVDISAVYGRDYVIEDSRFVTELVETDGTILEQAADEENRKNAQKELNEIRDQIIGSTAEVDENEQPVVDADGELSLAEMKALQSGKNVRDLSESDFHSLKDEFLNKMDIDIADYVAISSETYISFLPNETTKTLTFRILEDNESEGEEMFNFLLSAEDTHTAIIEANTSVSFIIEDDEPIEHSVVTLAADSFTAKDGIVNVKLSREIAEYSYITAGLRVTGSESGLAEKQEYTAVFQPYQTVAYIEIPVTQDTKEHSFKVELYDLKGGDEGNTLKAKVIVPAIAETVKTNNEESPDSYLDDFSQQNTSDLLKGSNPASVNIGGLNLEVKYDDPNHSNYGSIMKDGSKIGIYVSLDNLAMFSSKNEVGSGDHEIKIKDDGNPYLYLEYYSGWTWNKGESNVDWYYDKPNRYGLIMADVSSGSSYESAEVGIAIRTYDGRENQLTYDRKYIVEDHSRATRLATGMFNAVDNYYTPYPWAEKGMIRPYAERVAKYLVRPTAKFYGLILLYREYRVNIEQPDTLSFRSGELNADGSPKMISLAPAAVSLATASTRYFGEAIQLNEHPASDNSAIYGELKGYKIKPLDGKEFFYETNEKSLVLNDELIKKIDENTAKITKDVKLDGGGWLSHITLTIKPVYQYKNVLFQLSSALGLPRGAKYQYADKQIEAMRSAGITEKTGVFHVGDTLNFSATTGAEGYKLTRCASKK